MEDFKITLAAARVNKGMTQAEVAQELGISKRTLGNWENGVTMIDALSLVTLGEMYGVPIDHIFLPKKSTLSGKE